jgi:hypothetical protein
MHVNWQRGDRNIEIFCDVSRESYGMQFYCTLIRRGNLLTGMQYVEPGETYPPATEKRFTVPMERTMESGGTHCFARIDIGKWKSGSYLVDLCIHSKDLTPLTGECMRLAIVKDHDYVTLEPAEALA